ncbi:MAG: TonB-dependent receptor [Bryobacterales bacterium]|nr:TonB-dependent receptor [Bryobacterales bacterium]
MFRFALIVSLLAASCARAQVLYGTLTGTVEDTSGAVIPGAAVSITRPSTGQTRDAVTSNSGVYTLTNLAPGAYVVRVSVKGFQAVSRSGLEVTINTVTRADIQLAVGEMINVVTVEAGTTPLQTDKADVHVELGAREVTQLPIGGYRNYQTLLNLVPGATPAGYQNAVIGSPGRALTTNVNGTTRNNNNTRLDGAYNMRAHLPHQTLYVPPVESIETVNVSTNSFDAEQGFAGGAAINVATKSGSNNLHGVFFENLGNSVFNAKNFFYVDPKKPKYLFHTYGGTIGGPIVKNKLFFFGSWEGMRERSNFSRFATLATADQRAGNFSAYRTNIYDPATGGADARDRVPFPNATIPLSRQSAITRKLQDLAPNANLFGTASNFFASAPTSFNRDNYDAKVNYNLSRKTAIWGKVSVMDALVSSAYSLGAAGGQGMINGGGAGTGKVRARVITLAGTHLVTPSFLIDGNLSLSHDPLDLVHSDSGTNYGSEVLGIPGTNGPNVRQSGLPIFNISGYENYGNPYAYMPKYVNDNSVTVSANAGWQKSRHDIRFGIDLTRARLSHYHPETGSNGPRGRFDFNGGVTALNGGAAPNQFNAYAAYLLGLPQQLGKAVQVIDPSNPLERQYGLYFRDRWQPTRNLTLTMGLRWEFFPIMQRGPNSGIERYDFSTDRVFVGGYGNVPRGAGITASKRLFAPRLGIAYRIGRSTVLRAGYGISYEPYPLAASFLFPFPVMVSQDFLGSTTFLPYSPIERGIPAIANPDFTSGSVALPLTATTQTLLPGKFSRGYIQSFNFTLEREIGWGFIGSAGYVATRTIHQMSSINANAAEPGGGAAGRPLSTPFGRRVDLTVIRPFQTGTYDSLQARLDRRLSAGVSTKIAYTFGKAINWTDDSAGGFFFNAPSVLGRNRATASYDRTHTLRWAWILEAPKQSRMGNAVTRALLKDWQLNGIFSAYTGTPFTVTASNASLNAPGSSQTADQIKGAVDRPAGIGRNTPYYDPAAFAPVSAVRFGGTGRNYLRGPGLINADLGLARNFSLTERWKMAFRAEAFNFTNTPKFGNPSANASAGGFMTVTSALSNSGAVEGGERAIRFNLRFSF